MCRIASTVLYVLRLRPARRRARLVAAEEVRSLLRDLAPAMPAGGPLGDRPGLLWVSVPAELEAEAEARFPRLGYATSVDLVEPMPGPPRPRSRDCVRWRGLWHRLRPVYREEQTPSALDRRRFLLASPAGGFQEIRGYRGDSSPMGRRGLPFYDARLLVNLVFAPRLGRLLDPFAGAGGIVVEAVASGWSVLACDKDPKLRLGLARQGAASCVADARLLPFLSASVQALASEPPYGEESRPWLGAALGEMARVLAPGGRLALMVARWQVEPLTAAAAGLPVRTLPEQPVDRKGTPVSVVVWERAGGSMALDGHRLDGGTASSSDWCH